MSGLNSNFNSNMSFLWDGTINNIEDNSLYNVNSTIPVAGFNFDIFDAYSSSEHIDIFFYDKNFNDVQNGIVSGFADGIANGTRLVLSDIGNNGNVLTHETGHVLGLFHPYHSTFGNGSFLSGSENDDDYEDPNNPFNTNTTHRDIVECATSVGPNNGSDNTGDFVDDTLPDINEDVNLNTENCTTGVDPTFDYCEPNPNTFTTEYPPGVITNYMRGYSSTDPTFGCWDHFTPGQYRRMKSFITNQSHLNDVLMSESEADCMTLGNTIVDSFNISITECNTYSLTVPSGATDDYDIRLELGATTLVLNEGVNEFSLPTNGERITTYTLVVIRSIGLNTQREICFDVENSLPVENCTRSVTMALYPNPTSENIYLEGDHSNVYKVEIVTIEGTKIKSPITQISEIENGIDVKDLKGGIYFVNLYDKEGILIQTLPFIKK